MIWWNKQETAEIGVKLSTFIKTVFLLIYFIAGPKAFEIY